MVSLLTYSGGGHPRLLSILGDIQDALSQLLGDANELTQVRGGIKRCGGSVEGRKVANGISQLAEARVDVDLCQSPSLNL